MYQPLIRLRKLKNLFLSSGLLLFLQPEISFSQVSLTKADDAGAVAISTTNASNGACGVEINFGDGRIEKKRLEPAEQWQLAHNYKADGSFTVTASGAAVMRGIRSVGPCEIQQSMSVTVAGGQVTATAQASRAAQQRQPSGGQADPARPTSAQVASPGDTADLILFFKKNIPKFQFVTTIDGSKRLASPDLLTSNGYSLCYVVTPVSYKGLGSSEDQKRILDSEVQRNINNLVGNRAVRSKSEECIRGGQFFSAAEVVAVQRSVVSRIRELSDQYEQFAEAKYDSFAQAAARQQQITNQRSQEVAKWTTEINELSTSNSTEKVGSLSLLALQNEREEIKACTIQYTGVQAQTIIGYGSRVISHVSPSYRARASDLRATFDAKQPYSKVFKSVDEFYIEFQKNPRVCNIFVDFPRNLKTLLTALDRDKKIAAVEVNALVSSEEARDAWAKSQGYDNVAASEFAAQIRGNSSTLKNLAAKGITDKASYDRVVEELKAARYGDGNSPSEVLEYLDDKAAAAEKRGATAVSIRDDRARARKAEVEQRNREEARRRAEYAKEFPFTLTIKCHFQSSVTPIQACMQSKAGVVKSNLEIRNGSEYGKFQIHDIQKAGETTSDGLVIPLRSQFSFSMQNASDTLLLSASIVSNATQKVVWKESAAKFETLRTSSR